MDLWRRATKSTDVRASRAKRLFFFSFTRWISIFVWGVVVAAEAPTAMWKAVVPGDECASCAIVQDGSGVVHNEASAGR